MDEFAFTVKFLTPLLIHGGNSREADDIGLTGKALRGCWRFWFRALALGVNQNLSRETLLEKENQIFGSSDKEIGAKFRLFVKPETDLGRKEKIYLGFERNGGESVLSQGFNEGCEFLIKVLPRNLQKVERDVLISSIWVWANLGAIGQRARRGFGSPIIKTPGEPFTSIDLPVKESFINVNDLKDHLKAGLKIAQSIFTRWIGSSTRSSGPSAFILEGDHQVAVHPTGIGNDLAKAIQKIHGDSTCDELGYAMNGKRLASPVFLRLHKIQNEYYPVITWSKPKNKGCASNWLKKLRFKNYLSGGAL